MPLAFPHTCTDIAQKSCFFSPTVYSQVISLNTQVLMLRLYSSCIGEICILLRPDLQNMSEGWGIHTRVKSPSPDPRQPQTMGWQVVLAAVDFACFHQWLCVFVFNTDLCQMIRTLWLMRLVNIDTPAFRKHAQCDESELLSSTCTFHR